MCHPLNHCKNNQVICPSNLYMQFYIDPVNGYTFCSIKDVDCYLESGEIGSYEFKSKDNDGTDMELKADKSPVWVVIIVLLVVYVYLLISLKLKFPFYSPFHSHHVAFCVALNSL